MHLFHSWGKWEIIRKEVLEMQTGLLVPYIIQERCCSKCNLVQIKVSDIEWGGNFK